MRNAVKLGFLFFGKRLIESFKIAILFILFFRRKRQRICLGSRLSLQFISLQFISLQFISLQFISLQFISLQFISLQFISLQFISLQFIRLYFIRLYFFSCFRRFFVQDIKLIRFCLKLVKCGKLIIRKVLGRRAVIIEKLQLIRIISADQDHFQEYSTHR